MTSETAFYRATPQFVIELLASGTAIERSDVATKMTNYMNYGVDLSWVVDPFNKSVTVYRRKRGGGYEVEALDNPAAVSGENVLPDFEMTMAPVWRKIDRGRGEP
mmetsp:Transcript_25601/g.82906  ORF Transcript_25601/g.82906 Transcript_25601/m.82906 type:complete len:105 (-) Transcript_25601:425-739(-)